jgi:hypothetical protein
MPAPDCQATKEELRELVGMLVDEKLKELMGDPDEDKLVQETVRLRLLKQKTAIAAGERGWSFDEALQKLGLE